MTFARKILPAGSALAVLFGFGASTIAQAQEQRLTIWTISFSSDAANKALATAAANFEESHPGVDVEFVHRGVDEHKSALRIAAGADRGPDIFFSWAGLGLGGEYVEAGLSEDLTRYYDQYGWGDDLLGASLGFVDQYEGGRHGVPFTFKGEAVYYNKNLFAQAGVEQEPETYEELVDVAEQLAGAGIPAFTFGGTVNWHVMRLMDVILEAKCGAETHDALIAMELDWTVEPCAVESFEEMKMWAENYILSPFMGIDQAQSFNLFIANRAAMMLEGDWLVQQLSENADLDDFGLFPFPTGTNRLYGFAEYHYISSKSPNRDLAAEFLDDFNSEEFQQAILGTFSAVSVNANVTYPDDIPALQKKWLEIFNNYDSLFVNGDQGFPLDVTTEYFRVINEVSSGSMEPTQAAAALQTFIDNRE